MIRKAITILSLVSLLLSVGLWGVSYWNVVYTRRTSTWLSQLRLESGGLGLQRMNEEIVRQMSHSPPQPGLSTSGFNGWRTIWKPDYTLIRSSPHFVCYVIVPFWLLVMFFGSALCCACWPVRRRRNRKKLGLCVHCGYDLRASKDRCPGCGTVFSI